MHRPPHAPGHAARVLLALALLAGSLPACKKPEKAPSIRARGYESGAGLAKSGESGQAKGSEMTTDAAGRRFEELEFLSDGVTIHGTLVLPARTDPAPTVVLVHMLGRDRSTWKDFQTLLADEGIGSFAIDLRGHGASEGGPSAYQQFNPQEWQAGLSDVRNAMAVLQDFPERINGERLGVIGASIGANYAINYGSEHPNVPIIALSAGKDYKGVATEAPLMKIRRQVLLAGQTGDEAAADLLTWAQEAAPEASFFEEEGAAHGTDMLPNGPLEAQILEFLRARWGIKPGEPGATVDQSLPSDLPLFDDAPQESLEEEDPAFEDFAPPEEEEPPADASDGDDDAPPEDDGGWPEEDTGGDESDGA